MSSIFSELVADVLLAQCAQVTENEKYLIGTVLGVSPEELYVALIDRANSNRRVRTGTGDDDEWEMRAIELPKGIAVLPYLVNDGASDDPNQGNRGFNGKLRDWFDRKLPAGETRVLVTFDDDPVETQTSAMNEALQNTLLSPPSLLQHLESEVTAQAKPVVQPLLSHVTEFVESRNDVSAAELTQSIHVIRSLSSTTSSVAEVGERLVEFPWLLRDPGIEEGTAPKRLKSAYDQRSRVDEWAAAPDKDFDDEVRAYYNTIVADRLIGARRLGNVSWEEFTLEELQGAARGPVPKQERNRFNPASPATVGNARASTYRRVGGSNDERYTVLALVSPGACEITVNLSRPLSSRETIHLITYEDAGGTFRRASVEKRTTAQAGEATAVVFQLEATPLNEGWRFCEIVLTAGSTYLKNYLDKIDLGLLVAPQGTVLPFDRACTVDVAEQRFVIEDEAEVMTADESNVVHAAPDEDVEHEASEGGDTEAITIRAGSATLTLPVLYLLEDEDEPTVGISEASPEHALLRFAAREGVTLAEAGAPATSFSHGQASVVVGGRETPLADFPSLGQSRWRTEAEILMRPSLTNYLLTATGDVGADPALEELEVAEDLQPQLQRFMESRAAFFAAVAARGTGSRYGSVLAAQLNEFAETEAYVLAYAELLEAIPNSSNWQPEYERLLLMDSVRVEATGDLHVAPTSPLAVAMHLELQSAVLAWQAKPVGNLSPRDPDTISARFTLPLLRIENVWHEARVAPYPWRSYAPREVLDEEHAEPFFPSFIARRINAFLKVHPVYRDQRRTLVLAFINPGDGQQIHDALLQIIKQAARGTHPELDDVPQFEVKLFAADETADSTAIELLGAELDRFMSITQESGAPTWIEQELMRRLTYTKARLDEYLTDPSAFAHIAFVHNYFRPGTLQSYNLTERPSTIYAASLAPDIERASEISANTISFSSGVWLGGEPRTDPLSRIIGRSAEIAAAGLGTPVSADHAVGVLTTVSKQTIPALYERAVWVVHLDRHIGLELFYPQDGGDDSPYILDHTDQENLQESGFDAITATTMVKPYLGLIRSIFLQLVAGMDEERANRLLRWLNLLSGRWALQLLQERPNDIKERLGAVIAFRFLATREQLFDAGDSLALVITLDELLRVTGKEGLPLSEGWAAEFGHTGPATDDLLLLRLPLAEGRPTVNARIIEVKYAEGAPPTEKAWRQLNSTEQLLTAIFATEGAGKVFRGRVLAKLIRGYTSRYSSYGLVDGNIETDPRFVSVLDRVGSGDFDWATTFRRGGTELIGDFISVEPNYGEPLYEATPYASEDAPERKIGRIRIGGALIDALVANNAVEAGAGQYQQPEYGAATPPGTTEAADTAVAPPAAGGEVLELPADGSEFAQEERALEPPPDAEPTAPAEPVTVDGQAAQATPQPAEAVASPPAHASPLHDRFALPETELRRLADQLDQVFSRYSLPVQPFSAALADAGPNVIRFRTRMLEAGTIGSIEARARDIHRELAIDDPVYIGQEPPYVVVDIPRAVRTTITFADAAPAMADVSEVAAGQLPVMMGVDASGDVEIADLAEMPHLLVAGSTGSGKSVFLSTIGACLGRMPVSRVELVVVDIKGLDFAPFRQLPHTRGGGPIEDPEEAIATLQSLMTDEVQRRRNVFRESGARQIIEHYQNAPESSWPRQIVVMIDEYAQLASAAGMSRSSLESLVQQYAQFARAFGIYLVLATQRPSVDVITGRIKANLPARCVFRLPSFNDSRTVIDTGGAEKLLGAGDMLFYRDGAIQRLQAVYTSPADFTRVAAAL